MAKRTFVDNVLQSTSAAADDDFGFGDVEFQNIVKNPVDVCDLDAGGYFERALEASLIGIHTLRALKAFINKCVVSIDTGACGLFCVQFWLLSLCSPFPCFGDRD